MINQELKTYLSEELRRKKIITTNINKVVKVYGGSVNQSYGLISANKKVFIKLNDQHAFPKMFEKEKESLELLAQKTNLKIPRPLALGSFNEQSFLILEFIEEQQKKENFWQLLGAGMAQLHRNTSNNFGFDENNYNGSLIQQNCSKKKWVDFFIENRLIVQEKLARSKGALDAETGKLLNKVYSKLSNLFPVEKPALLHGDFWSGNFMTNQDGTPVIMDPAVYYGHREMDISMSMLFGGFDKKFYQSYQEHFPLETGWEQRVDICNLYPLLIHVNLFGASYVKRVKNILKQLA